jgi:nucleotidyltransferase substrate binding protein (TIGR01987 family)
MVKNQDIRWKQRFSNFQKAFRQFEKAIHLYNERDLSNLEKQGLVQAFEYTHELAWKTLKDFLEYQGDNEVLGSRDATRKAFQMGLLEDGTAWMGMIKNRNLSTHTYNEETVNEIVTEIADSYYDNFKNLILRLKKMN